MLPSLLVLLLATLTTPKSLTFNSTNLTINSPATYTLNITRDSAAPVSSMQLYLPNGTLGVDLSTSTAKINGSTPISYAYSSGDITFSSTSSTNFLVTLSNVINPSYALTLSSSNAWVLIGSENISLMQPVSYTTGVF